MEQFYFGNLPDLDLQEKVVEFAKGYFPDIDIELKPDPESEFPTIFGLEFFQESKYEGNYPFNFFGIIPLYVEGICEHMQFVFDRSNNGRLVTLEMLPKSYGFKSAGRWAEQHRKNHPDVQVVVQPGGYNRSSGGAFSFPLLLNIIRLRYWPQLTFPSGAEICHKVGQNLWAWGLAAKMLNEELNFIDCLNLYVEALKKRFPAPEQLSASRPAPLSLDTNASLDSLNFSAGVLKRLAGNGIGTIGHLLSHSPKSLGQLPGIGKKTLKEILRTLDESGIALKSD